MDNPDYNVEDPVTSVRQSWFPRVRGGGVQQKKLFFLGHPFREVWKVKNASFRVARDFEEQEERREGNKTTDRLVAI